MILGVRTAHPVNSLWCSWDTDMKDNEDETFSQRSVAAHETSSCLPADFKSISIRNSQALSIPKRLLVTLDYSSLNISVSFLVSFPTNFCFLVVFAFCVQEFSPQTGSRKKIHKSKVTTHPKFGPSS